ncbi:hypothetical protein GCM10009096_13510 [Parasphingorhabdus litoris]|uniref:Tail specific protease domain-containing protein n=1 Tax=Parasphingorhabdus litoris TaxID=394733 RepID=A0ABP3K7I6_9SPHN|nr:S41 family peptidase [Parasphingorhabdus litoris]
MLHKFWSLIIASLFIFFLTPDVAAEEHGLSKNEKNEIIMALGKALKSNYVFPEKAENISQLLQQNLRNGGYDKVRDKSEFASELTNDIIEISNDLHFVVGLDPKWVSEFTAKDDPARKAEWRQKNLAEAAQTNFGFDNIKRLEGNIGYVSFTYFANPEIGHDTAAATMKFIENTDAIIFDLRYNNGGYLEMAQFLASYLFSAEKDQLLFDYYYNEDGKRIERGQWVLPALPSKRLMDKPVYILTGSTSFSSAEWFSYTLQKLGRATLIGERTAGGAHPVTRVPIDDEFFLQTPIGEIRDPVDKSDFEGQGVVPDHQVASKNALVVTHMMALETLAKNDPAKAEELKWLQPVLLGRSSQTQLRADIGEKITGAYEGRKIVQEDGQLFYIWRDRFRLALTPIAENLFSVEGIKDFRFRFLTSGDKVTALERINRKGPNRVYKRID